MTSFKEIDESHKKDHITEKEMHQMKRNHCVSMIEQLLDELHEQAGIPRQ